MSEEQRGFYDRDFEYVWQPPNGQLTANQSLKTQQAINVDADFWCAGWYVPVATGAFEVLITDSDGYQWSNIPMNSAGLSVNGGNPQVLTPSHRFPAGGKIQIDIRDLSGATNNVQINFKGWKRMNPPVAA